MKIRHLALSLIALALPFAAQAQQNLKKGVVQCFLARGDVVLIDNTTGEEQPLQRGMSFTENYGVRTGPDSSALLLFSNGASINLNEETMLNVAEFKQAPTQLPGSFVRIQADPSQSVTNLYMAQGHLIGEVKQLRPESDYSVSTPAGIAEVLGTVFEVTYNPETGEGSINVPNGTVSMIDPATGQSFTISNGQGMGFNVTPDGAINFTGMEGLPPAAAQQIQDAVTQALQEAGELPTPDGGGDTVTGPPTGEAGGEGGEGGDGAPGGPTGTETGGIPTSGGVDVSLVIETDNQ